MRKTRHELFLERAAALRVKVHELHAIGMKTSHIARQLDITAPRVHQILWPNGKKPKGNGEQEPAKANGDKPKRKPKKNVDPIASILGTRGAAVTNSILTSAQRSANASKAAKAKWAKAAEKKRAKAEAAQ
jgi:hypothetical protein